MTEAKNAYVAGDPTGAFRSLERAHILGQRHFVAHMATHWWMLRTAIRQGNAAEARGQVLRMIAVVPGFLFGWVPKGNTGGANVSALEPMAIPPDLAQLLEGSSVGRDVGWRIGFWAIVALGLWAIR